MPNLESWSSCTHQNKGLKEIPNCNPYLEPNTQDLGLSEYILIIRIYVTSLSKLMNVLVIFQTQRTSTNKECPTNESSGALEPLMICYKELVKNLIILVIVTILYSPHLGAITLYLGCKLIPTNRNSWE